MRYIIDTEMNLCNDISPILFTPSIEPELKVGNHIFTHKIVTYSISINSHGRFIPFFLRLCKANFFFKKKKIWNFIKFR